MTTLTFSGSRTVAAVDQEVAAHEAIAVRDELAARRQQRTLARDERDALITQNLPLVGFVVNRLGRLVGRDILLDREDLMAFGTEGLIAAVDTFDATRGLQFSGWAVMHIRTTILDELRRLDPMRRSLRTQRKAIDQVAADFANTHGRWPTVSEIAAALGQPVQVVQRTLEVTSRVVVSIDRDGGGAAGDEGSFNLANLVADDDPAGSPEESLERHEISRLLADAIASLPAREELLIVSHYRQGLTMRDISRLLNVSESRVSQLHERALRQIRAFMEQELGVSIAPAPRRTRTHASRPAPAPRAWQAA
jgi:RNA polymerase sigma factor for flagellar operon FliA